MEIILHLGARRTGTTAIQEYLRRHRAEFEGAGVSAVEPRHPVFAMYAPYEVFRHSPPTANEVAVASSRWVDSVMSLEADRVLVSNEALLGPSLPRPDGDEGMPLYGRAPAALAGLRAAITGPVRLVLYIRDQAAFVRSQYAQWVRRGLALDWEPWIACIDPESLSWRPMVDAAVSAFGPENVLLKNFQLPEVGLRSHLGGFVEDVLGMKLFPGEIDIPGSNRTLSAEGLRLARAIADVPLSVDDRRAVSAFLARQFAISPERTKFEPMRGLLEAVLHKLYAEENQSLLATYGGPDDAGRPLL